MLTLEQVVAVAVPGQAHFGPGTVRTPRELGAWIKEASRGGFAGKTCQLVAYILLFAFAAGRSRGDLIPDSVHIVRVDVKVKQSN